MNNEDQFERRLQQQEMKPLPVEWRNEIVAAAQEAAQEERSSRGNEAPTFKRLYLQRLLTHFTGTATNAFSQIFLANRKGWAALAAAWCLIIVLNLASRDSASLTVTRRQTPPSPLVRELLQQQERLFVELVGPNEQHEVSPPKHVVPGPRSHRREDLLRV